MKFDLLAAELMAFSCARMLRMKTAAAANLSPG